MARIIPNNNTWIGFIPVTSFGSAISGYNTAWNASQTQPNITAAEIATAYDMTPFVISVTAQSTGNTVPTPSLDTLFEGNVPGTVNASFTADFYRDDASYTDLNGTGANAVDFAWTKLPRGQKGYFVISRFNDPGSITQGTNQSPASGNVVEIWPVVVTARTAGPVTSNTVQTFTVTGAVPQEPAEGANVIASASAVPSAVVNLVATRLTQTASASVPSIGLDWDTPAYTGTLSAGGSEAATPYVIQVSTSATGTFTDITQLTATSIASSTNSLHVTSVSQVLNTTPTTPVTSGGVAFTTSQGTSKTLYFRVAARNANGVGTYSNVVSVAAVHG